MNLLNYVVGVATRKEKRNFSELSDWVLVVVGIGAFLVAGYWGMMLGEIMPEYVKKVNEVGFSLPAISLGLLFGIYGIGVWFFGCIAARCHTLIYERWFK